MCVYIYIYIYIYIYVAIVVQGGPTAAALKAVSIRGSICVSLVSLAAEEVRLGRLGYLASWRDALFGFELRNESAVATACRVLNLPPEIEVRGSNY